MHLVERDHKALRATAKPVPLADIGTPKISRVIAAMRDALAAEEDGVAIAAPQVGASLRLFVVSGKIFDPAWEEGAGEPKKRRRGRRAKPKPHPGDLVFINPKIIRRSKETAPMVEGCLSLRWLYGNVERSLKATIEAYDEHGKRFTRGASGLLSQIFQHETDHLEGVLFIDKAKDIEEIPPGEDEKAR